MWYVQNDANVLGICFDIASEWADVMTNLSEEVATELLRTTVLGQNSDGGNLSEALYEKTLLLI